MPLCAAESGQASEASEEAMRVGVDKDRITALEDMLKFIKSNNSNDGSSSSSGTAPLAPDDDDPDMENHNTIASSQDHIVARLAQVSLTEVVAKRLGQELAFQGASTRNVVHQQGHSTGGSTIRCML